MTGATDLPLDIGEVIDRIAAEGARRRAARGQAGVKSFPMRRKYALSEFLELDGADFVRACHTGLLRRDPGPAELAADTDRLRSGRDAKADLLIRLRWSAEGRRLAVKVSGLKRLRRLRRLRRVPVLGPIAAWVVGRLRPIPGLAGALDGKA
jgi:O-antigen chain-terminating methyltransferase